MKSQVSLYLCRRNINVVTALFLSVSLIIMPFLPIRVAMSAGAERHPSAADNRKPNSQREGATEGRYGVGETAPVPAPAPEPFAPVITATKTDALISDDGDSKADPGGAEKIEYTVTISNTGTTDATGVTYTDTIDAHTTLVNGSITTQPIAVNDTYSALGNVRIQVPDGASDLLANDCDPDPLGGPCTNTGLTISVLAGDNSAPFAGTSTQGGQVTAATNDGSFQYNPAPGFEGSDSFTYTVTDSTGKTDTATVNITVTGMIWFVNAAAGGGGDGRLTNPFNCLVGAGCFSATAADDPGDNIFLYSGTYNDNAALVLLNNQKLIGQAASAGLAAIAGVTVPTHSDPLPATGGASPVVTSTATGIQLASGNTLRGFTVGNTSIVAGNYDIANTTTATVGTLGISEVILNGTGGLFRADSGGAMTVTFSSAGTSNAGSNGIQVSGAATGSLTINGSDTISGVAGSDVVISGGTLSLSCSSNITHASSAAMVDISSHSAGTVTFTGTLGATNGTGLQFNNADGTYNFNGTTTLNGGDAGVDITNGSGGTFGFASGTSINNPSGIAYREDTSTANVTYGGTITKNNNANNAVDINAKTGGTTAFGGSITASTTTANSIDLTNTGGTVNFTGGLSLTTTSGIGFNASGSGATVNATQNNTSIVNTISSTTGAALSIVNTTIGASDVTFRSISANGGTNGIVLTNTGSSGGLTVTGNSSGLCGGQVTVNAVGTPATVTAPNTGDCTGGTIQSTTGDAILATNTMDLSLTRIFILNAVGHGINAPNLRGTSVLANSTIRDYDKQPVGGSATKDGYTVVNSNTNLTKLTISDSTFDGTTGNAVNPGSGDGVFMEAQGTSSMALTVDGCVFTEMFDDGVQANGITGATGTFNVTVKDSAFVNATVLGNGGVGLFPFGDVNMFANVESNTFDNIMFPITNLGAISMTNGLTANFDATIQHNTINNLPGSRGITFTGDGTCVNKFKIDDNTIDRLASTSKHGISLNLTQSAAGTTATADATITSNRIGTNGCLWRDAGNVCTPGTGNPLLLTTQNSTTMNALISNNTVTANTTSVIEVVRTRGIGSSTLNATVTSNTITDTDGTHTEFDASTGTGGLAGGTICLDIASNVVPAAGVGRIQINENAAPGLINVRQTQLVVSTGNNNATVAVVGTPTFGTNNSCAQPTLPMPPSVSMRSPSSDQRQQVAQVTSGTPQAAQPSLWARAFDTVGRLAAEVHSLIEPTAYAEAKTVVGQTVQISATGNEFRVDSKDVRPSTSVRSNLTPTESRVRASAATRSKKVVSNHAVRTSAAVAPLVAGETISITIGTLRAGDSVTITFQVTVNDPPNLVLLNPPRVTNQGTVSGSNFSNVLTDDPAVGGASDSTETPVDLFDTTTTLVSDLNPSNFGDLVTFTATVAESPTQASADPTGTVDFIDTSNGNAVICNDVAVSGGTAQCQTSSLTAGTHNIRADYSGDGNFDPSQSNIVAQVVNACTPNPIVTSTADSGAGTLRQALADVCSGTTITFNIAGPGPHTITLTTGELAVAKNVTINNNSGESITISGNNLSRVFNINSGKTAAIIGLTMTGGTALDGGAIVNDGALTVVNSTLFGNSATGDGGAISTTATGTSLTLINTTISGNTAAGSGGGLNTLGGTVSIINTTISNNTADSDNNAAGDGGGIRVQAGTVTLKNTIVAGNFNENGASDAADDISGTVDAASSFNLIGTGGAGGLTNGVNNNQVGVASPGLGSLASNGGTTQTHALLPTSPAVETGSNANLPADTFDLDGDANTAETLPVDQRGTGFPRVADSADADTTQTVDIGAFELHPSIEDIGNQTTNEDTVKNVVFNLGDDTGSLIATVTATSSNTTLVPNANLSFSGSGGSRTLQITPAANQSGMTTITVTVTATNGRTATDMFDLTVTATNDPPAGTDNTVSTAEETAYTFTAADFGFTDPNDTPPNTLLAVKITTLPALGTLTNNNVPVNAGDFIPVADINGGLLKFTPATNGTGSPYTSFTFQVQDNGGGTDLDPTPNTMTINVTGVNDGPVNTVPGPQNTNEDTALVFSSGNANQISVADVDAGSNPIKITLTATNGTITLSTTAGLSFITGDGTADATMMFTGTLTAVNTALNGMSFNPTPDFNGSASLQIVSDDQGNTGTGGPLTDTDTVNITVNAQNDAPVVTTTAGNLSYTENAPATAIDPGLTVTDNDSANLVGATVALTAGFVSAQDTLAFSNTATITGNYNSGTGVLTLTGTDTVANYQAALRSVTYQNSSDNPTASRTVTFTADDGTSTGSATRGITINAVNDPPVNTVPGPQSTNQNTPLVFSSGNGNQISVADVDAGTNAIQVTLTATNGTLTLSGTSGLAFTVGDGTADATMTFTGTIANINTALNGMTFTPTMGFSGAASLTITTNDLGNTGSGGPLTDTDVVNIQVSTNISIQDAQVVEPTSGSVNMIFTVTLSAPAPASGVSVNFTTQDEAPALNHATAGQDYTTMSGTLNFAVGEQFKTILVPVLADNNMAETNETFLVLLSSPVNGQIADGMATGTILITNQPGTVLISELRTSGPAGAGDDFVEIYNNSSSAHVVNGTGGGYGLFKMGATCSDTPVLIGVIPNGTTIPARGHYLFTGSAYSLANYGGTGAAAGDTTLSSDIENDRNVAIFSTASLGSISSANRLDAVGFGPNTGGTCDLFREGNTLTPLSGSTFEYSFFRDECGKKGNPATFGPCPTSGSTKDSNVNSDDFIFADTNATSSVAGQRLGAPGPQNLGSPRTNLDVVALLLDSTKGAAGSPNRVRDTLAIGPNAAFGTMAIRRRFQNNTGAPVTKLRIRVVDISTTFVTGGVADLRVLTSGNVPETVNDPATCAAAGFPSTPCNVTILGTTLETPPAQPLGGGFNSSITTGTVTLGSPLAPGATINLVLLLGVQQTGSFKFFFNVEALP